jgi:cytochrome c2
MGAGAAAGALYVHLDLWPYPQIARRLNPPSAPVFVGDQPQVIESKFFDLRVERFPRQLRDKPGLGGGLSPYGDDAVLIEGDGTLSLGRIDEMETVPLRIAMPPSGREVVLTPAPGAEVLPYQKNFWHRYLDLVVADRAVFLSYQHYAVDEKCFSIRVARVDLEGPLEASRVAPEDWRVLFETQPCFPFKSTGRHPYAGHEGGGQIVLADDGFLYLTVGNFEFDGLNGPDFVQDPATDYGKTLRIDPVSGAAVHFTIGHRNPQGLVQTPDGRLWSTEQGPEGGDELNVLVQGENYGWPLATYGTEYGDKVWPMTERQGRHAVGRKPAFAWVPSIATSNITHVSGFNEIWDGNLLVAALADASLWRVVTDGDRVVTMERIAFKERLRSVLVQDGYLLVYADTANLLRVSPIQERPGDRLEQLLASLSQPARREMGQCLTCHGRNGGAGAPNLCGVLGRTVGQSEFDRYSPALAARGDVWDAALLERFLENAPAVVPGTAMPNPAIADAALRREIVGSMDFFCD